MYCLQLGLNIGSMCSLVSVLPRKILVLAKFLKRIMLIIMLIIDNCTDNKLMFRAHFEAEYHRKLIVENQMTM